MGAGLDGIIFDDLEWPQPGVQGRDLETRVYLYLQVEYLKNGAF